MRRSVLGRALTGVLGLWMTTSISGVALQACPTHGGVMMPGMAAGAHHERGDRLRWSRRPATGRDQRSESEAPRRRPRLPPRARRASVHLPRHLLRDRSREPGRWPSGRDPGRSGRSRRSSTNARRRRPRGRRARRRASTPARPSRSPGLTPVRRGTPSGHR